MIQRIQTIFLALVAILGIVFSFLPILEFTGYETTSVMSAYKTISLEGVVILKNMGVGVLQGIVILLVLVIVFMFKKRQLQIKLGKLTILLIAIQIAAIVFYSDAVKAAIQTDPNDVLVAFKAGAIIPVLSLIFTYLAVHFIKKDDKMVRAADRLR
jgi:hypothetical protein